MSKYVRSYVSLFFNCALGCLTGLVGEALRVIISQADVAFQYLSEHSHYSVVISMCVITILVYVAFYWVSHFAPEASGSGIQEIEGFLQEKRPMDWRKLLPAKFGECNGVGI